MICYTCRGDHPTANDARLCQTGQLKTQLAPVVIFTGEPTPSEAQLRYIKDLGGDVAHASTLSRRAASDLIGQLKASNRAAQAVKKAAKVIDTSLVPAILLEMVPEGNYAVRAREGEPYVFLRITRPTTGQYSGYTKIQTRHGDNLKLRLLIEPSGHQKLIGSPFIQNRRIDWFVKLLLGEYRTAAIAFGRYLEQCSNCGATLTDARSRHYAVGPECEKSRGDIIAEVEDTDGPFNPLIHS